MWPLYCPFGSAWPCQTKIPFPYVFIFARERSSWGLTEGIVVVPRKYPIPAISWTEKGAGKMLTFVCKMLSKFFNIANENGNRNQTRRRLPFSVWCGVVVAWSVSRIRRTAWGRVWVQHVDKDRGIFYFYELLFSVAEFLSNFWRFLCGNCIAQIMTYT